MCMVAAITEHGHGVSLTRSLEIGTSEVEMSDVIKKILDLEKAVHEQNVTNTLQQSIITGQHDIITNQQANFSVQQAAITNLQHRLDILQADVNESKHVETGSLHCGGPSDSWPKAGDGFFGHGYFLHQKNATATFQKSYPTPPVVFLSTNFLFIPKDQHVHYATQLLHVDQHGFSIRCGSGVSGFTVEDLGVSWISVPV